MHWLRPPKGILNEETESFTPIFLHATKFDDRVAALEQVEKAIKSGAAIILKKIITFTFDVAINGIYTIKIWSNDAKYMRITTFIRGIIDWIPNV